MPVIFWSDVNGHPDSESIKISVRKAQFSLVLNWAFDILWLYTMGRAVI